MDFTRSTSAVTMLDLVNVLGRGGTDDWRALYQQAKRDPALRASIAWALELVDPELGEARALWTFLLAELSGTTRVPNAPSPPPPSSPSTPPAAATPPPPPG